MNRRADTESMLMTVRTNALLNFLIGTAFIVCSMSSLAMPKAAEHADAPVTMGTDVPKPKRSTKKTEKPVAKKAKPSTKSKAAKTTRHPKKSKAAQGQK